jgi:putative endonuclease
MKKRKFNKSGKFFAYILECQDGTYYTGYTNDLAERIELHNKGKGAKYTRDRRPVKLVWRKEYRQFKPAFKVEKIIKQLTRLQKEALVKGRRLDKVLANARIKRVCPAANVRGKLLRIFPRAARTRPQK